MGQDKQKDILVLAKRMGTLLNEVYDLSRQLAEAVDRDDQVSIEMLVAMRREPVEKLLDTDDALREELSSIPDPELGVRMAALLNGEPAQSDSERVLAGLAASNTRRWKQVLELDRVLNKKLARDKSIYQ